MTNRFDWQFGASSGILTHIYGICDYSFKQFKENGIKNIEISLSKENFDDFNFIKNAQTIKRLADNYGVNLWSLHIPFGGLYHPALLDQEKSNAFMNNCLNEIKAAISIGIKTIVIHPSFELNDPNLREQLILKSIANLTILSNFCHKNGCVLAVENLPRTCLCNTASELIRFVNEVPHLQICFDTNHSLQQNNIDFLNDLIKGGMTNKIRTIHASDYDFINERHWLPLEGINEWQQILSKLEELNYSGVFMYEVTKPIDKNFFYTPKQLTENFNKLLSLKR